MWLLAVFLITPIVEITLFIMIGNWLSLMPTLGLVVLSAICGAIVLSQNGSSALIDLAQAVRTKRDPTESIANTALLMLGGVLLIIPGFFTDGIGIALMFHAVRESLIRLISKYISTAFGQQTSYKTQDDNIIDAEFYEINSQMPIEKNNKTRH